MATKLCITPDFDVFKIANNKICIDIGANIGDVTESLRLMSRRAAESCLDALYTGCIMLNPGLDVDSWVALSYGPPTAGKEDNFNEDDDFSKAFLDSIKNFKKNRKQKNGHGRLSICY